MKIPINIAKKYRARHYTPPPRFCVNEFSIVRRIAAGKILRQFMRPQKNNLRGVL